MKLIERSQFRLFRTSFEHIAFQLAAIYFQLDISQIDELPVI